MASEAVVVEALYTFKGSNNDELCFKKGDLIAVTQKDEGWWEGTLNGKTGWFPCNYVKETKDSPKIIIPQENQYKSVVLKDLIDSERAHIAELEGLVTNFLQPLEKSSILSSDEYKQLTGNIVEVLETRQQLLKLIEIEDNKPTLNQRVGKLFIDWAPRVQKVHQTYCSLHPRAVCILDKYKDELTTYMESRGAASPGVLVLTILLSKPFRRLEKYPGMLQELERHIEECHPDRGDTQRCVAVYKEIAAACSATRRQKELELQVLTGPVKGWEGPSLATLGEVICMASVAVGPQHADRYYVLFPNTLLILSVSFRLSSFIYEGKLPLSGMQVKALKDNEQYKNAFEISTAMTEPQVAVCQSRAEASHWVELLKKQIGRGAGGGGSAHFQPKVAPSQAQYVPQQPTNLNQRGYCTRTSILSFHSPINYTPTLPAADHPPCAPFAHLTRLFSKHIKNRTINHRLLNQLLYSDHLNKANLHVVRIRHHRTECTIAVPSISVIRCDSDDSSGDSDARPRLQRQNATESSDDSSGSSNPFGYIRYFETKYESFVDYGKVRMATEEPKPESVVIESSTNLELQKQASDASSCLEQRPFGACENLHTLDDDLANEAPKTADLVRQSCPTKLVGNKYNTSSLTTIYIPDWAASDGNISCKASLEVALPDPMIAELLYNSEAIAPPARFQTDSINKPRRRSSIQITPQDLNKSMKRCVSTKFVRLSHANHRESFALCKCVECHSRRSSDSGMAGSCTLNSPDLAKPMQGDASNGGGRLSEIDFEAQCPCTSPFGSTPRQSTCMQAIQHSCTTSVTSSCDLGMAKMHSRESTINKSKSVGCMVNEVEEEEEEEEDGNVEGREIFRSGLYAHWWLKAKIPASVVRGIYLDTRAPNTGKGTPQVVAATTPSVPINSSTPKIPPHGFSSTSLRPLPSLRPCLSLDKIPYSRPIYKYSSKTDAAILDVIEAYISSTVKPRNTANSVDVTSWMKTNTNKDLSDTVQVLQSQLNVLDHKVMTLSSELCEEKAMRCALQSIVQNLFTNNCKDFDKIEWPTMESNI